MQDSLGIAVLHLLGDTPSPGDVDAVVGQRTTSPEALDLYLEGCGALLRPGAGSASRPAIESLRAATAADSLYAAAWVKLAEAEMAASRRTKPPGDLAPAWNAVNTALRCDSSRADAHHLASILHNYEDRPASAARSLRHAHAREPRNVGLLEALAFSSLRQKRFDEAVRYYRDALRMAPDYTAIHAGLGWLYGRLGQRDEELASTLQAARLAPANLYALNRLGACYYERDELALARRYWEKAFVIQPDCTNTANLGLVTYLDGRFEDAVGYFQYGIEHCDSLSVESWANLAAALYWTRDRRDDGVRIYRRAIVRAEARLEETPDDGLTIARLADYHAMAGDTARALELIERASAYSGGEISAEIAYASARLGHDDQALRFAGDAVRRGFPLSVIRREPLFMDLVKDERFRQMVELSKQEESGN
jgi:tetratricopeptide (TPR) repeat protein